MRRLSEWLETQVAAADSPMAGSQHLPSGGYQPKGFKRLVPPPTTWFYDKDSVRRYSEAVARGKDKPGSNGLEFVFGNLAAIPTLFAGFGILSLAGATITPGWGVALVVAALFVSCGVMLRLDSRKGLEELKSTIPRLLDVDTLVGREAVVTVISDMYDEAIHLADKDESGRAAGFVADLRGDMLETLLWDVHANLQILRAVEAKSVRDDADDAIYACAQESLRRHHQAASLVLENVQGVVAENAAAQLKEDRLVERSQLLAQDSVRTLKELITRREGRLRE